MCSGICTASSLVHLIPSPNLYDSKFQIAACRLFVHHLTLHPSRPTRPDVRLQFACQPFPATRARSILTKSTGCTQPDLAPEPSSFQSQTVDKNFTMSTGFFCFISSIQGCSNIRQGVARRDGSFSKLNRKSANCASFFKDRITYQHSIKYLKYSDHFNPLSSSSFNFGIGCLTI